MSIRREKIRKKTSALKLFFSKSLDDDEHLPILSFPLFFFLIGKTRIYWMRVVSVVVALALIEFASETPLTYANLISFDPGATVRSRRSHFQIDVDRLSLSLSPFLLVLKSVSLSLSSTHFLFYNHYHHYEHHHQQPFDCLGPAERHYLIDMD